MVPVARVAMVHDHVTLRETSLVSGYCNVREASVTYARFAPVRGTVSVHVSTLFASAMARHRHSANFRESPPKWQRVCETERTVTQLLVLAVS